MHELHTQVEAMTFLFWPQVLQRLQHTHFMLVHIFACDGKRDNFAAQDSSVVRKNKGRKNIQVL